METKFKIVPYTKEIITGEAELADAKEFLLKVKEVRNNIEAERKELTKPILDSKKKLDDKYKNYDKPFAEMEQNIKKLMADYLNRKELEVKKDFGKDVAKLAIKDEKVSFRIDYDIEITDISKVAKEFLMINESKIKAKIREGQKTFAGIKLIEKKIIISR